TPVGDVPESLAINALLGEHTHDALVTGTKSMTGHLLGGAGAVEAIFTVLALHNRVAPPTINIENVDPKIDLNIVRAVFLFLAFCTIMARNLLAFRFVGKTFSERSRRQSE
ncbi:hypothetical protein CJ199_15340, partial [Brevibacterium paucivorans]